MKLLIFMTVVVFGIANGEDQKEMAQLIVNTETEFANLNTLKNWDKPQSNMYHALATICSDHLEKLKQRYIKQFKVNLDQYPGSTFPVSTNEGEVLVTKPTTQSTGFDQEALMTRPAELSQEIVNQHVTCDQLEQKKEGDGEPCRSKLNCMKKSYMEEKGFTYSDHPTNFPIEYKGEYTSMASPPEDIKCEGNGKPRRKRTADNRQVSEKSNTRRRRTPEYPINEVKSKTRRRRTSDYPVGLYGEESKTRRRRAPENPVYGEKSNTRRRRSTEYQVYGGNSNIRRRRTPEYPVYEEKAVTRRRRTAGNPYNGEKAKSRTKRTSDNRVKRSVDDVFPSFADKWKSTINPKFKSMYVEAKRSYEKKPKGDSQSEMRRNLAVGLKSLIHAAMLFKHSYDPVTDSSSLMGGLETRAVDWVTGKLVDLTIKKTLGEK